MIDAPQRSGGPRSASPLSITPLQGLPLFAAGMSLAGEIEAVAARENVVIDASDIVVVAQKIVSKVEGRAVRLRDVTAGPDALALAERTRRPAGLMQLILDESQELLRVTPGVIIARHKTGHVLANAGIDASNVEGGEEDSVLLWPRDPDASARKLRAELRYEPAVIIADSLGRAWRLGTIGHAIGATGLVVLEDRRGELDLFGRTLQATLVGVADSIAAAAVLAMGEGAEGAPVAIVKGAGAYVRAGETPGAGAVFRSLQEDLFR